MTERLDGDLREEFLRGIALFNAGLHWEAHEAWEAVWNAIPGEERLFFQGLIQAAAAMVHRRKENPHGIAVLSRKALEKLDRFPAEWRGVDLERFRGALRTAAGGGDWPRIEIVGEP